MGANKHPYLPMEGGMETIYSAVGPTNSLTSIAYAALSRAHSHLINISTYFKRATESLYV